MLLWFVIAYWIISVAIGLWAALRVKSSADFAVAGRHLPFFMVTATVFATWFGSEAVLGIPATFIDGNLKSIVADPFGSSLCLIFVGLFFAAPLYRMRLLTIGDFYKRRYGRKVEVLTSLAIVVSYLGWVGAQITALGLVFNVVSQGSISQEMGMWIGSGTILIYTFFGGMWAVAITDLVQMVVIGLGLLYIGGEVSGMAGGVGAVVQHASAAGKFTFLPNMDLKEVIAFTAAACTMMLGSIPQQDVFQRVQSAKTEKIAVWGSVLGGGLYFLFAFVPLFIGYAATMIAPDMVKGLVSNGGSQLILPQFVMQHMPFVAQVLFFGALLSAIKGCASATLLAPSVSFSENILKPMLPKMDDKQLLKMMRIVTLVFTALVMTYAMNSKSSIFGMVESAYQVTLVAAFVPLAFGVYWRRATNQGALLAIAAGVSVWLGMMWFGPESPLIPAQFAGLMASIIGIIVGSLMPQFVEHNHEVHDQLHRGEHAHESLN
ncbi:sodium:solute symporter family protein [Burkholderiaceae bacterium DAT-1]|nr:sodium:solute symporter family protein [Burkholderiaceae bacterium DAT-1]